MPTIFFDEGKCKFQESKVGCNNQYINDPYIRKSFSAEEVQIECNFEPIKKWFADVFEYKDVTFEFGKLLIYTKGGFFNDHEDRILSPNHVGTLVVGTNFFYTGGELVLASIGKSYTVDESHHIFIPIHTPHKILPVEDGLRVVLTWHVFNNIETDRLRAAKKVIKNGKRAANRMLKNNKKLKTCDDESNDTNNDNNNNDDNIEYCSVSSRNSDSTLNSEDSDYETEYLSRRDKDDDELANAIDELTNPFKDGAEVDNFDFAIQYSIFIHNLLKSGARHFSIIYDPTELRYDFLFNILRQHWDIKKTCALISCYSTEGSPYDLNVRSPIDLPVSFLIDTTLKREVCAFDLGGLFRNYNDGGPGHVECSTMAVNVASLIFLENTNATNEATNEATNTNENATTNETNATENANENATTNEVTNTNETNATENATTNETNATENATTNEVTNTNENATENENATTNATENENATNETNATENAKATSESISATENATNNAIENESINATNENDTTNENESITENATNENNVTNNNEIIENETNNETENFEEMSPNKPQMLELFDNLEEMPSEL